MGRKPVHHDKIRKTTGLILLGFTLLMFVGFFFVIIFQNDPFMLDYAEGMFAAGIGGAIASLAIRLSLTGW